MPDSIRSSQQPLILIANEQEWSARSLESILSPGGYDVLRVFTGAQAIELVFNNARPQDATPIDAGYLDADLNSIRRMRVTAYERRDARGKRFQRGDTNTDDRTNLADAVFVLNYLFRRGTTPACKKSADINDDGRVNLGDAADLLRNIFSGGGEPIPEPFQACGIDPTTDNR